MNIKRLFIILAAIVVLASAILIYKIATIDDVEIVKVEVEPIPQHVELPVITGVQPEMDEVKFMLNEETLYVLSHIMGGEAGADWCSDEMQLYTGSVFLNRIESPYFPNSAKEVAFQTGQYSCTRTGGGYWKEPTPRTVENAKYLLIHGSQLPNNVLFQSQFRQGDGVYKQIGNQFYCYKGNKSIGN